MPNKIMPHKMRTRHIIHKLQTQLQRRDEETNGQNQHILGSNRKAEEKRRRKTKQNKQRRKEIA